MDSIITFLIITAFLTGAIQASDWNHQQQKKTCFNVEYGLHYTIPYFVPCKKKTYRDGDIVQTIPKLISGSTQDGNGCRRKQKRKHHSNHIICRFPDCLGNPCSTGWCEESLTGYICRNNDGFSNVASWMSSPKTIEPTSNTQEATPNTLEPAPNNHEAVTGSLKPDPNSTATFGMVSNVSPQNVNDDAGCPDDWLPGLHKCYLFPRTKDPDWDVATGYCNSLSVVTLKDGMKKYPSLFVPESDDEVQEFRDILKIVKAKLFYSRSLWLNCKRNEEESFSCYTNRHGNVSQYRST
ncbi:uncharacterized protein LOC121431205 [Lytechinus variegatus]|uniref:uncharacterized protein LOC121431205 n=1 Tax=Lytechinus variegatus TaxID=7654 RepID=UPI001BB25380|nr:uncharacterized protein LOC121431205 [Lytechinus variegatus]